MRSHHGGVSRFGRGLRTRGAGLVTAADVDSSAAFWSFARRFSRLADFFAFGAFSAFGSLSALGFLSALGAFAALGAFSAFAF